jgi:flagellar hook-associated protein 2
LASGLDVDTIVTSLVSDKQLKIDKANQSKQTLQWKQTAYQNIIDSLNKFQGTYLSTAGSSSMLLSKAYVSVSAASSNSAISVTSNADAVAGSHSITVTQTALAGKVTGNAVSGFINPAAGTPALTGAALTGTNFNVTVDGVKKNIAFSAADDYSDIVALVQGKINTALGIDKVSVTSSGGVISIKQDSQYNSVITVTSGDTTNGKADALPVLGFTSGASNKTNTSATLSSLFGNAIITDGLGNFAVSINNVNINLNVNDSLTKTLANINSSGAGVTASYSSTSDSITILSSTTGASTNVTYADNGSGTSNGFFAAIFGGAASATGGKDALFSVDGVNYSRDSNNFVIDGLAYSVNKSITTATPQSSDIKATQDVSTALKNISDFVTAYNSLVDTINTATNTKPDKNYPPLTDVQKKQMNDTDVTNWNNKAQSGLLFNDATLNSMMTSAQNMLYQSVSTSNGKNIALYQIGITTTKDYTNPGKLEIDTDKLTAALQNDSASVSELFSKSSSTPYDIAGNASLQQTRKSQEGLAYRLQDLIKSATTTGLYPYVGSLVAITGSQLDTTNRSSIIYQLKDISSKITDYTTQMTTKKNQLYAKFTALETAMQRMNTQSSMISSFGSGSK